MKVDFCTHINKHRQDTIVMADWWLDTGNRRWEELHCSQCGRIWRNLAAIAQR